MRIAFATDNGLAIMTADGTWRQTVVDLADLSKAPHATDTFVDDMAWSPDGSRLLPAKVTESGSGDCITRHDWLLVMELDVEKGLGQS